MPSVSPTGVFSGPNPYRMPPSRNAVSSRIRIDIADSDAAATIFCRNSRIRGTGIASRYFSDDQDASDAIVSPKNSAMTTVSRKVAEKITVTIAKLPAESCARSTIEPRVVPRRPPTGRPPNANAITRMTGSSTIRPRVSWVRRRFSWRRISTPKRSVRPAR